MAIIAAAATIVGPSLSAFFGGRDLHNEARRMLGLIRYARSQAVSLGEPLALWVSPETGTYGLSKKNEYAASVTGFLGGEMATDFKELSFHVADGLLVDCGEAELDENGTMAISFLANGAIEGEEVSFWDKKGFGLALRQADVGLGYRIVKVNWEDKA
jgi:hypothetical protein